ncbi:Hypothetical protein CAP_3979 [Chondromyces apiculatus DSM 436]|uniref:Protein kinase domain-containing protein n=1 Tax=Chondromyces apiculatus DSM 436 TaxID=1192034 RepID=A0A017THY9_9BACT|nr:Hypothetical protein CAP_3979 [Chondromyces apiculatus DSM 436]
MALRPGAAEEPIVPAPPRAPEPSLLDIDIDIEEPTEEPVDIDALFGSDDPPAAPLRSAAAPPLNALSAPPLPKGPPTPSPSVLPRPVLTVGSPPKPPPTSASPPRAAERPSKSSAPPAGAVERPSKPSTPFAHAVERPSRPSAPLASALERPSQPSAPLAGVLAGVVERPSKPSQPLAGAMADAPALPVHRAERPSRPSAPLVQAAQIAALDPAEAPERFSQPPAPTSVPPLGNAVVERLSNPAPAPAVEEPGPGSIISGRYRLEQVIGRGGMGAVWLARDTTLDIDVALKLIRRDRTTPEARVRLLQEARAAARIGHPSIVRVFDFGETAGGDPFIVMELLHGESLSSVLARRQRLAPALAVSTLLPLASALVAAHGKGIVHRDLKPDNILLVNNEAGALVPKLLDFGIARLLSADQERRFTLSGEVLGSPDYMSPEQAKGEDDVGEATDIWAFTVVLYEVLTGRRPFQGPNYNALILAIITQEPLPVTDLAAGDTELWGILQRGLRKRAADRWQTMRDLGAALGAWAIEHGVQEDVAGTSVASHWLAGARPRTLSVYPVGPARTSGAPAPGAVSPVSLPPLRMPMVAVETVTRPPFVPNRRRWGVVAAFAALAVIGVVAFLLVGPRTESTDSAGASTAPPASGADLAANPTSAPALPAPGTDLAAGAAALTAPGAPSATTPPGDAAPSAAALAPAAQVTSAPPPTAPPRIQTPVKRRKRTAPPAPKDIKF